MTTLSPDLAGAKLPAGERQAGARRRSHVFADSITMLRRNLLHMIRYPSLSLFTILGPVIILLLVVYVFGGTLGAGLPGVNPGDARTAYLDYVIPGILLITIAGTAAGTATTVSMDMTEGITARFRTMAISRTAVIAGHVLGNTIQAIIAAALVLAVGVAIGFRATAGLLQWVEVLGILALVSLAVSWLGVAMGMQARSAETASNLPLILTALPLLGSGFVPTASMPGWMQSFAQNQPFTPFIETVRELLLGTLTDKNLWLTIGWAAVLVVAGCIWSIALYERKSVR